MNSKRYHYKYSKELFVGEWNHSFSLIGRFGALALNIREYKDTPSAGLEYHHKSPLGYMDDAPSRTDCYLLNGPCWHDGTSLYATETYLPVFQYGDHERIFRMMTRDADRAFYPGEEEQ